MKNTKKIMAAVFAALVLCLFTGCGANPLSGKTFEGKIELGELLNTSITLKFKSSEVVVTTKASVLGIINVEPESFTTPYEIKDNEITFKINKDDKTATTFIYELHKKNLELYIGDVKCATLEQK